MEADDPILVSVDDRPIDPPDLFARHRRVTSLDAAGPAAVTAGR